jgi:hypothetical protein
MCIVLKQSKLATAVEYANLKKEMENLGYNINIVKKQNYKNIYLTIIRLDKTIQ